MPIYTYFCTNCCCDLFNLSQEALVPFEERDKQTCDLCKIVLMRAGAEKTGQPKWKTPCPTASAGRPTVEDKPK